MDRGRGREETDTHTQRERERERERSKKCGGKGMCHMRMVERRGKKNQTLRERERERERPKIHYCVFSLLTRRLSSGGTGGAAHAAGEAGLCVCDVGRCPHGDRHSAGGQGPVGGHFARDGRACLSVLESERERERERERTMLSEREKYISLSRLPRERERERERPFLLVCLSAITVLPLSVHFSSHHTAVRFLLSIFLIVFSICSIGP